MAKKESTFINMVITLVVISLVASFALGSIYNVTKEPIEKAKKEKQEKAIREVIPPFDRLESYKVPSKGGDSLLMNVGFAAEQEVGFAVASYSNAGYDPTQIVLMVGFLPDRTIHNIVVIQQKETPGLGTKMKDPAWKDQYNGKNPETFNLKVKKDGGEVDAITAATISSRAFSDAVIRAYDALKNQEGEQQP
jgi:electron transport complex protein RnfG